MSKKNSEIPNKPEKFLIDKKSTENVAEDVNVKRSRLIFYGDMKPMADHWLIDLFRSQHDLWSVIKLHLIKLYTSSAENFSRPLPAAVKVSS